MMMNLLVPLSAMASTGVIQFVELRLELCCNEKSVDDETQETMTVFVCVWRTDSSGAPGS